METSDPVISVKSFSKTFSGRTVLRSVDLDVLPGEVHGLLGQNGSGKSTLIKILAGYHEPDQGASLWVRGQPVSLPLKPGQPRQLGMSFVHQDLGLVESATVLENVRVGRYETRGGWRIRWRRERQVVTEALKRFGVPVAPEAPISSLREVERAMVAIVRALDALQGVEEGLLVLDEPTPYLPRDGVERLFETIREVAASGVGVLFVTHRLEEVQAITDRVTILRDGARVETAATASLGERDLIERILGFSLEELYPVPPEPRGEIRFAVHGLSGGSVRDFSLEVRQGEIVGLTGLLGMGWEQVPYLLFGGESASAGSILINGRAGDLQRFSPSKAMAAGIALLPANRLRDGGLPPATVAENLTLPTLRSYFSGGLLRRRRELHRVQSLLHAFDVRPPEPERIFSTLSGGNQQKVLVAKWFETKPKVLLLHEPAQGVDVGARTEIFKAIRDAAEQGAGVILCSAEYEDLAHLCDRVIVFRNGKAVAELHGENLTVERLVEQSFRDERRLQPAVTGANGGGS